jgi:hypothetical protein
LAHLTVAIIDDAARKPSGEKGGEKPLFSARPSPYRGLWPHIDTVGFFDTLKHCIYQGSDSKGKLKQGTIFAADQCWLSARTGARH